MNSNLTSKLFRTRILTSLAALALLAVTRPAARAQGDTLLARPDFQNVLYDPAPIAPPGTSLAQPASVTLLSGSADVEVRTNTPNDGTNYLVLSLIGQPVAPAFFWYLAPAPLLVHQRMLDERLSIYSAVDVAGRFRNHYSLLGMGNGIEYGAYGKNDSGFDLVLKLVDGQTGVVLSSNDVLTSTSEALALFTNSPGLSYSVQATTVETNAAGSYTIALYPVVRPGAEVSGVLTAADPPDPFQSGGAYRSQDYLLMGVSRPQTVRLRLESTGFDGKLEVARLDQPELVVSSALPGSVGAGVAQMEFTHQGENYLVRVTSGLPLQTGSYRLVVERKLPVVAGFSPLGTNVGGTVVITGDFWPSDNKQSTWVGFGGGQWVKPTPPNIQTNTITVLVPSNAVSGPLMVTNINGSAVSSVQFVVWQAPPQIRAVGVVTNGQFSIEVTGAAGGTVVIETATNLSQPILWLPLVTNQLSGAGTLTYTVGVTNQPRQQFYRTRVF